MDYGPLIMLTPEQELRLIGGGDSPDHYHSSDREPTIDALRRLQQLEIVVTVTAAMNMATDTNSRNRNADIVRCDTTAGAFAVTLPDAKSTGRRVTISRVAGGNNVTVAAQGGETVQGTTTLSSSFSPHTFKDMSATAWEEV